MIFAFSDSVNIAIISGLSAGFGAIFGKIPAIIQSRAASRVLQLDALQKDYSSLIADIRSEMTSLKMEVGGLRSEHAKCQVENERLNGEIILLKFRVAGLSGNKVLLTESPDSAIVVAPTNKSVQEHNGAD